MRWPVTKQASALTMLAGLFLVTLGVGPASAQIAASQPTARQAAPSQQVREVYPRDLMTLGERFEMWRKMRAAKTHEERFELWANKRLELEKRAAAQGVVLRDHGGPMMMGHGDGEPRMGMSMMNRSASNKPAQPPRAW